MPVDAALAAIAAFFNFMCTDQGQKFAEKVDAADNAFHGKCVDLFGALHDKVHGAPK